MEWLSDIRTTKTVGLLIFFITFCLIVLWVYGSRKRGERLEEHKNIPFLDDDVDEAKDKSNG
jgi:cbb3-type cytochrome oxidase subunit 3